MVSTFSGRTRSVVIDRAKKTVHPGHREGRVSIS